ncbi:hypothetical protein EZY14_002800 [Kordia sp. TARA_039_SRF]|nr:hypothetical protein EZY14_002800 [Kordia sp. TARA_039_SRF]
MQNSKKKRRPTKEQLAIIKSELQALNPAITHLKVKKFYNQGKVTAHANLGRRRIHVRSSVSTIANRFIQQYNDRYPTAFPNISNI